MTGDHEARGDIEALEIYQRLIDAVAAELVAGRYAAVTGFFNYPLQFRTQGADMVMELREEMEEGYHSMIEGLRAQGLTDILFLSSRARFLSPGYIEGFHVSHYLSNATPIVPPFNNRTVLRLVDGNWLVDEAESEAFNARWPIDTLKVDPNADLSRVRLHFPREDARTSVRDPLDVYARFLRAYSDRNMAHDFEGWSAMHLYPHTIHTDAVDKTIKAPDGIKPFFDMLSKIIREHDCDWFERAPTRAEFLSANKICGYHTGALYSGEALVMGPIKSRMILQRVGPDWFLRSVTNAVSNDRIPWERPKVSAELIGLREIQARRLS